MTAGNAVAAAMTSRCRSVAMLLAVVVLGGCAVYSQPSGPVEQLATVSGSRTGEPLATAQYAPRWAAVEIRNVDGQQLVPPREGEVRISPGVHTITVIYSSGIKLLGKQSTGLPIDLTFRAEAGRAYRVEATEVGRQWSAWVVDVATGEVVAGRPR